MKKSIFVCLIIALVLSGCSSDITNQIYTNKKMIADNVNRFRVDDEKQQIDGQVYIGKLAFEGMDTVWIYHAKKSCKLDITYQLSVSMGKAKLVLISPKGALTTIAENADMSETNKLTTRKLTIRTGENRIKLVAADHANIEFAMQIAAGRFYKLG